MELNAEGILDRAFQIINEDKVRCGMICEWRKESDNWNEKYWETGCHNCFSFTEGGVEENGFKYCMYCGGVIKVESEGEDG